MATTFYAGPDARIRTTGGDTVQAGINKWTGRVTTAVIPTPHFEVTADADGNLFTPKVLKGWSEGEFEISGFFNGDTTNSAAAFLQGSTIVVDFLFSKTGPVGVLNVTCTVTEITYGVDATGNQAATFSAKLTPQGAVPRP